MHPNVFLLSALSSLSIFSSNRTSIDIYIFIKKEWNKRVQEANHEFIEYISLFLFIYQILLLLVPTHTHDTRLNAQWIEMNRLEIRNFLFHFFFYLYFISSYIYRIYIYLRFYWKVKHNHFTNIFSKMMMYLYLKCIYFLFIKNAEDDIRVN